MTKPASLKPGTLVALDVTSRFPETLKYVGVVISVNRDHNSQSYFKCTIMWSDLSLTSRYVSKRNLDNGNFYDEKYEYLDQSWFIRTFDVFSS